MKQKFLLLAALAGGGNLGAQAQQLPNGGFENWDDCVVYRGKNVATKVVGTDPVNWNGSNISQKGAILGFSDKDDPNLVTKAAGNSSTAAVYLHNCYEGLGRIGSVAPAYVTLGTPWAYAEVKNNITIVSSDGGSFGGMNFNFRPDAIKFDYKRAHFENPNDKKANRNDNEAASVVAYLWKGSYTNEQKVGYNGKAETMTDRDRFILGTMQSTASPDAKLIAEINAKIEGNAADWTSKTIEFTYKDNTTAPEKLNVIFCAGDYFGDQKQLGVGNSLTIDNVEFVYYHELTNLTYGGKVYTPNADGLVEISDAAYDANTSLEFAVKGVGATVEKGAYNPATHEMTLEVRGNDFAFNSASKTVYTLRFKSDAQVAAPELASLSISGVPFTELKAGQTEYTLPFAYNPGLVFQGTANGTATVSESVYDNAAKTHTVNVVDATSNKTTKYVFSFTEAVADAASGIYDGSLSVVLTNSANVSVPTALNNASINVTKNANGTINLAINNFSFGGIPVGDIFVSNVPMNADKIEKTRRTILMTAFNEDGTPNTDCLGWMMGALPVEVSAELNTTAKNTLASIDIITADNPMLSQMFKGIHVDFVPFTVKGNLLDDSFSSRQYYENLTVSGHVTKAASKFLQINNHFFDPNNNNQECNLPMSFLDLSKAIVDANVTMDDIMAGAPKANNTLVYLPAGSTIQAANAIVDSKATNFVVNDQVAFHAPKAFTATQVSYDRAFKFGNGYVSSFVLPFAMNTTYVDGKVYKFNAVNGDNVNFTEVTGQLKANVPYLIVANSANPFSKALANGVQIEATPKKMEVKADNAQGFAHIGSYNTTKVTSNTEATYYGYTGGKFVKANTGTLNPFRTLIKATGTTATQFSLKLDGEVTGIIGVNTELGKVDVYNLEGKLVRSQVEAATALQGLEKGVYVINGKKVMK